MRKTVQDALALLVIGGAVLSTPPAAAGFRHIHVGPPIVVAPPVSVPPPMVVQPPVLVDPRVVVAPPIVVPPRVVVAPPVEVAPPVVVVEPYAEPVPGYAHEAEVDYGPPVEDDGY